MRVASKVGTFIPNLGTLGIWVLELFAMYATADRQTHGQTDRCTDKRNAYCSLPYGRGHNTVIEGKLYSYYRKLNSYYRFADKCSYCVMILQNIFNDAEDFSDSDEWMEDDLVLASASAASSQNGTKSPPPYCLQSTLTDFGKNNVTVTYTGHSKR